MPLPGKEDDFSAPRNRILRVSTTEVREDDVLLWILGRRQVNVEDEVKREG